MYMNLRDGPTFDSKPTSPIFARDFAQTATIRKATARLHVQPRTALVSALLEVLRAPVAVPRPVAALPAAVPAPAPAAPPAVVPVPPSPAPVVAAPLVPPSEVAAPSLGRGSRVRRRPRPDPYERQIQARAAALRRQALRREARVAAASAGSAADA